MPKALILARIGLLNEYPWKTIARYCEGLTEECLTAYGSGFRVSEA